MSSVKVTPMIEQYLSIKEKYGDAILFYRMGDFYEMFFEDAETASATLEIALTSRNKNNTNAIPMCGVPVKSADTYIGRLIEHGYKVAVCDQTEDPATAKGLVKRDVVRVVTPGMVIDNELLDQAVNNYILAVSRHKTVLGFSCLDISTGTFRLSESSDRDAVRDELLRIAPREVVFPRSAQTDEELAALIDLFSENALTFWEDQAFDFSTARDRLIRQLNTRSLEGFGCNGYKAGVSAAGALLAYVKEMQKQEIPHFVKLEAYYIGNYLLIDGPTRRNLELTENLHNGSSRGTLLEVLDTCVTALGSRLLRQWLQYPLLEREKIRQRQDAVEEAKTDGPARSTIRERLKTVYDLERLASKAVMGRANARDLLALKRSMQALPELIGQLAGFSSPLFSYKDLLRPEELAKLEALAALLENSLREDAPPVINEGGLIKPEYSAELAELISLSRDSKSWLASMEAREKETTGINSLKVRYNKVFGYYLEVPKTHIDSVPPHYIRKQTLVNAERYITEELKTFETKALGAEEQRMALELSLFTDIRGQVIEQSRLLYAAATFVARVDLLCNLAEVADNNGYIRPEVDDGSRLMLEDGRHPVVEKMLTAERYVPNSITLDDEANQVLLITGPNMAGKSTVLRQVALFVVMTQMGSFVPAKKALTGIFDRIFTRVGALDNLAAGQSTFMVEMEETANIINNASPRSLVVIDEIGRGTSTYDGLSIAWAVAEHLHDLDGRGVKTLFATHYHELTELENLRPRVKNFNIAVKEWNDDIIFLRKLVAGSTNRSYGIQVARLAGIPETVISRAKSILFDIENGAGVEPVRRKIEAGREKKQVQLSFFETPEKELMDSLRNISISRMTPLEALNYLHRLKQKAVKLAEGQP